MCSSSEGSVFVLYICISVYSFDFFADSSIFFNKSIGNTRLVCVWGGGGGRGYVSIKLRKYFQASANWIKYLFF